MAASCAKPPALKQEYLSTGETNVPFRSILQSPNSFKGKLYILGGIIVEATHVPEGSLIGAVYIPADSKGRVETSKGADGKFLALLPRAKGTLDPGIYREGRTVIIAGEFSGLQHGTIEEQPYLLPVFVIRDIHPWEKSTGPFRYTPYPSPFYNPSTQGEQFWKTRPGAPPK